MCRNCVFDRFKPSGVKTVKLNVDREKASDKYVCAIIRI